jgi:hypothetical protein
VVRERGPGRTPHGAIRDYVLTALAEGQPMTGLSDLPHVLQIQRLIHGTPAVAVRRMHYDDQSQRLLAEALVEEGASEWSALLIATQIMGAMQTVFAENGRRVASGESPDDIYPDAVATAEHAFRLLERGLGDLLRRAD